MRRFGVSETPFFSEQYQKAAVIIHKEISFFDVGGFHH